MYSHKSMKLMVLSLAIGASVLATGCGEEDAAPAGEAVVDVPQVADTLALTAVCDVATQIRCAGAFGCCGDVAPYESMEVCSASASLCEAQLAEVTGSALFAAGTVIYDGSAAAAKLRLSAQSTSTCGLEAASMDLGALFVGTLAAGADCSPQDESGLHLLSCAPGLGCSIIDDEEAGTITGTCRTLTLAAPEDEEEHLVDVPSKAQVYCAAPPPVVAPANGTIVPTALSIKTIDYNDYAGTSSDITLHFIQKGKTTHYYCTIEGGMGVGDEKICTDLETSTWNSASSHDSFYVEMNSNDGLAVGSVAVCLDDNGSKCTDTHEDYAGGTFDNGNSSMLRNLIPWGIGIFDDGYDYFWVDGNSYGDCNMAKVKFSSDNNVICSAHGSH